MAISLVQSKVVLNPGSGAGSFTGNTTAGNCLVVGVVTYATTNVTISTSACTLGGSAGNFAQAVSVQSGFASTDTQFLSAWVDPNCAGGQTAIAVTASNATWTGGAGLILMELAGVALTSPVDTPFTSTGQNTTGTAVSSGTNGSSAVPGEWAIGLATSDSGLSAESGSFTNLLLGSSSPYVGALGYATMASGRQHPGLHRHRGCPAAAWASPHRRRDPGAAAATTVSTQTHVLKTRPSCALRYGRP